MARQKGEQRMKKVFFVIPDDVHKLAKSAAALSGMLLRDYIAAAIKEKVAREGDDKEKK
jgi:hypothetical protein